MLGIWSSSQGHWANIENLFLNKRGVAPSPGCFVPRASNRNVNRLKKVRDINWSISNSVVIRMELPGHNRTRRQEVQSKCTPIREISGRSHCSVSACLEVLSDPQQGTQNPVLLVPIPCTEVQEGF